MDSQRLKLIDDLALKVVDTFGNSWIDVEKNCWLIVHQYHHGVLPTEYDVREVEEELFLAVLETVKTKI